MQYNGGRDASQRTIERARVRVAPAREAPAPRRGGGCVSCVALGPTVDSDRPNPPGQPPRSSRFVRAPVGSAKGATGATRVPGVAHASLQKIAGGINQREEPGKARVMNRIVRPARQSKFFRELLRNVRGASDALSVGGERTRIRGISLQPYPFVGPSPSISYPTTTSTSTSTCSAIFREKLQPSRFGEVLAKSS